VARLRGSFPARARSQRRRSAWDAGPGGTAVTSLSNNTPAFLGSAVTPTAGAAPLTVVRIRGQVDVMLTLATAAGDGWQGAIGIGLATTAAVVAGISSVPTPTTEQGDENWLWWHVFSVHNPLVSSSELNGMGAYQRIEIDTKAMRKFDDGMSIYAAINQVETGTATMDVFLDTRMLTLLP